jgi:hypothetical protein
MGVGEEAATALALVIHELATNALKYGALSNPDGTLDISGTVRGDEVEIVWSEHGGPPVVHEDGSGYGSKLIRRTMEGTLGGPSCKSGRQAGGTSPWCLIVTSLQYKKQPPAALHYCTRPLCPSVLDAVGGYPGLPCGYLK